MSDPQSDILVIDNISKSFGELVAIENASMTIRKGEIHALVGENVDRK